MKHFDIKNKSEYCQKIKNGETIICKYSETFVTYIISLILEDPDVVKKI